MLRDDIEELLCDMLPAYSRFKLKKVADRILALLNEQQTDLNTLNRKFTLWRDKPKDKWVWLLLYLDGDRWTAVQGDTVEEVIGKMEGKDVDSNR